MRKQILSLALALAMCLGLSVPAAAKEAWEEKVENAENYFRFQNAVTERDIHEKDYFVNASHTARAGSGDEEVTAEIDGYTTFWNGVNDFLEITNKGGCEIYFTLATYQRSTGGKADYDLSKVYTILNDDMKTLYLKKGESYILSLNYFIEDLIGLEDKGDGKYVYDFTIYVKFDDGTLNPYTGKEWFPFGYWFRKDLDKVQLVLDKSPSGETPIFSTPTEKTPAEKPAAAPKFTDVAATSPYAEAIQWAVEKEITKGTSATTFSPNQTCTVGQILTFLWRANDRPNESGTERESVTAWADGLGIDTSKLSAPCTRAMAVNYIWKAYGSPTPTKSAAFTDVPLDADYTGAVAWAVEKGVTSGKTASSFAPGDTCTRGQIVTFLYRANK